MNSKLKKIGLTDRFLQEASLYEGLFLGRVVSQYNNLYKVTTQNSDVFAEVSGKLRYSIKSLFEYPSVGDFVLVDRENCESGNAIIHHLLTRKSAFVRKAAGTSNEIQVIAANIDIVFICMSLNNDFNLRRVERYLSIAWDSGATPVIVLTKSDLCEDSENKLEELSSIAIGVDTIITSALDEDGYKSVLKYISEGKTVAFIGSSGVGKSTLINRLIGKDAFETAEIRNDDKGRHTTTRRELIAIPSGGVVIDTPGMREIGIESADFSKSFSDIDEIAIGCKFRNCTHKNEPNCAVLKAVDEGQISKERLLSYLKLKREANYDGLNSKQIEQKKINEMYSEFGGAKNARDFIKSKNKKE